MNGCDRRLFLVWLVLGCLLTLGHEPVAAATMDVTRDTDGEISFCNEGYACVGRAVGDVNGDGFDDVVFEVTSRAELEDRSRLSRSGQKSRRNYELHIGPFAPDGQADPNQPANVNAMQVVRITLYTAQAADVLRLHDLDQDGRDDLVFARTPDAALLVLPGRDHWEAFFSLHIASGKYYEIELPESEQPPGGRLLRNSTLSSAVADVDGDGVVDLIVANGVQTLSRGSGLASTAYIIPGSGSIADLERFDWTTQVIGIGACTHGIAGAADVTGDGLDDIVLRRCPSETMPTQLRVLPGRVDWPSLISAEDQVNIVPTLSPTPPPRGGGGGGGYLPGGTLPTASFPEQVMIEDIDGDGTIDLGIAFAGKTHLFPGGPDIVERARAGRSSAVMQMLGLGAMPLTNSWRLMDLDGDDKRDLLLSQSLDTLSLACPGGGCASLSFAISSMPIYGYTGQQRSRSVIDPRLDVPDLKWQSDDRMIWGAGDFNGDGIDDLLLGSAPRSVRSVYSLVYGPLHDGFIEADQRAVAPGPPGGDPSLAR